MTLKRRDFVLSPHTMRGAEHCEAARLFVPEEREGPSHAQWWGIALHRFIEYAFKHDRAYALRYIKKTFPRSYDVCEKLDLDMLPVGDSEVQFVLDMKAGTGGALPQDDFDSERHIKAKCDLYSTALEVHVIDFKSGDRKVDLLESIQIAAEATGAWLDGDRQASRVRATILNIVKGEFIPTDLYFDRAMLQAAYRRLERVHLLTLEARAEHALGDETTFTPGAHCEMCHCRSGCPSAAKIP